jgi:hypothetical protein
MVKDEIAKVPIQRQQQPPFGPGSGKDARIAQTAFGFLDVVSGVRSIRILAPGKFSSARNLAIGH